LHTKKQARNTQQDQNKILVFVRDCMEYFKAIGAVKNVKLSITGDNIDGTLIIDGDKVTKFSRLWRNTNDNN